MAHNSIRVKLAICSSGSTTIILGVTSIAVNYDDLLHTMTTSGHTSPIVISDLRPNNQVAIRAFLIYSPLIVDPTVYSNDYVRQITLIIDEAYIRDQSFVFSILGPPPGLNLTTMFEICTLPFVVSDNDFDNFEHLVNMHDSMPEYTRTGNVFITTNVLRRDFSSYRSYDTAIRPLLHTTNEQLIDYFGTISSRTHIAHFDLHALIHLTTRLPQIRQTLEHPHHLRVPYTLNYHDTSLPLPHVDQIHPFPEEEFEDSYDTSTVYSSLRSPSPSPPVNMNPGQLAPQRIVVSPNDADDVIDLYGPADYVIHNIFLSALADTVFSQCPQDVTLNDFVACLLISSYQVTQGQLHPVTARTLTPDLSALRTLSSDRLLQSLSDVLVYTHPPHVASITSNLATHECYVGITCPINTALTLPNTLDHTPDLREFTEILLDIYCRNDIPSDVYPLAYLEFIQQLQNPISLHYVVSRYLTLRPMSFTSTLV
jgi:hypothetical protein